MKLPIGIKVGESSVNDYEIAVVNGVAEEIILKKRNEKPYTTVANILSATIASLGSREICHDVREAYLKNKTFAVPSAITNLFLSDANTAMVEIHRTAWQDILENQPYGCGSCGHKGSKDLDLNKVDFIPEHKELVDSGEDLHHLTSKEYELSAEIIYNSPKNPKGELLEPEIDGKRITKFVLRAPKLKDAINNERYIKGEDTIHFWRHMILDCIVSAKVGVDGEEIELTNTQVRPYKTIKLLNELLGIKDLKKLKEAIVFYELPVLGFFTESTCDSCGSTVALVVEQGNFFAE